jgi:hypothetical protein
MRLKRILDFQTQNGKIQNSSHQQQHQQQAPLIAHRSSLIAHPSVLTMDYYYHHSQPPTPASAASSPYAGAAAAEWLPEGWMKIPDPTGRFYLPTHQPEKPPGNLHLHR